MSLYQAIEEVTQEENKQLKAEETETPDKDSTPDEGGDKAGESDKKEAAPAAADKGKKAPQKKEAAPKKSDEEAEGGDEADGSDKKEAPASPPAENADFARMRRDKAAAERRAAILEEQIRASAAKPAAQNDKPPAAAITEPDPNNDPEGHLRWQLAQTQAQLKEVADWKAQQTFKEQQASLKNNAIEAFERYENDFKAATPDYEPVTQFGVNILANSIRTLNPHLKGAALADAVQRQILRLAGQAEAQGHNPAEYLYHQAMSWGYQPAAEGKKNEEPPKEAENKQKPSIKNISEHKKKSASSMEGGGRNGKPPLSREAVLDKSFGLQDFARLTPAELKELEQMEG